MARAMRSGILATQPSVWLVTLSKQDHEGQHLKRKHGRFCVVRMLESCKFGSEHFIDAQHTKQTLTHTLLHQVRV